MTYPAKAGVQHVIFFDSKILNHGSLLNSLAPKCYIKHNLV